MKFLCDQMLIKLGKWLRIAGYDTAIITTSMLDRDIAQKALDEKRLLITRDRHFTEIKKVKTSVIWLQVNSTEECVHALNQKLHINWTKAAFSRCTLCNTPLIAIDKEKIDPQVIQHAEHGFFYCTQCHKVYWKGSHTKRMHTTLLYWQSL